MAILSIPTLGDHIWQTKCWQIFPPKMAILEIIILRADIKQIRFWQIYPLQQTVIIDSYSERSYLVDQVVADLPPYIIW